MPLPCQLTILSKFEQAQTELVGTAVILTDEHLARRNTWPAHLYPRPRREVARLDDQICSDGLS